MKFPNNRAQGGYTILQLVLVIALMSMMAVLFLPTLSRLQERHAVNLTRNTIEQLMQASIAHYSDEDEPGNFLQWPGTPTVLVTDGYFFPGPVPSNPYGEPYAFRVEGGTCPTPPNPCPNDAILVVSTRVPDPSWARAIIRDWSSFSQVDDSVPTDVLIEIGVVAPAQEGSHWMLVGRDGSRPMLGNLDMDSNSVILPADPLTDPSSLNAAQLLIGNNTTEFVRLQRAGIATIQGTATERTEISGSVVSILDGTDETEIDAGTVSADTQVDSPRLLSGAGANRTLIMGGVFQSGLLATNRTVINQGSMTGQTVDAQQLTADEYVYR